MPGRVLLVSTNMQRSDYVSALRRDGSRLAAAAADALDKPVAACPGWNVADLVWHTGEVHHFWRQIASGAVAGPEDHSEPERPYDADLVPWFRTGLELIASTLENVDPATPVWTWAPQQDAAFVQRRMAQETAVHCWDTLEASGEDEPIEQRLAVDGIDEFFAFMLADSSPPDDLAGGVHLHATDCPGEWLVRSHGDTWEVTHGHAKGDAAVRATASDLLLLLWRRRSADDLETYGDRQVLDRFLAAADLD